MGDDRPVRNAVNPERREPRNDKRFDERDSSSLDDEAEHDRWLRENVPPHHG